MDFSEHILGFTLRGEHAKALRLWDSVFEVVDLGADPSTPVFQNLDTPLVRRMPCCRTPCDRCAHGRGRFRFPFSGIWTRRAVFPERLSQRPGGMGTVLAGLTAWTSFRSICARPGGRWPAPSWVPLMVAEGQLFQGGGLVYPYIAWLDDTSAF